METSFRAFVTPEQVAAVQAGDGFARVEDPSTHRVYFLIEQTGPIILGDDYFREKIDEAYTEGGIQPLDMAKVKAEFQLRQASRDDVR
jgi:hypothetical protein